MYQMLSVARSRGALRAAQCVGQACAAATRASLQAQRAGYATKRASAAAGGSTATTKKVTKKKAVTREREDAENEPAQQRQAATASVADDTAASREAQLQRVQASIVKFVNSINFWRDVNLLKKVHYVKGHTEKDLVAVEQYLRVFQKLAQEKRSQWTDEEAADAFLQLYVPLLERSALLHDSLGAVADQQQMSLSSIESDDVDDEVEKLIEQASQQQQSPNAEMMKKLPKSLQLFFMAFEERTRTRELIKQMLPSIAPGEARDTLLQLQRDITGRMAFHMMRIGRGKEAVELFTEALSMYRLVPAKDAEEARALDEALFDKVTDEDAKRICFLFTNAGMSYVFLEDADGTRAMIDRAYAWASARKLDQQLAFLRENQASLDMSLRAIDNEKNMRG